MHSRAFVLAALFLAAVPVFSSASSYIVPTTTLLAQTSNNTSTANTFVSQSSGNRGAGNVSKVDVHSLLYPGASTKVYAHMLLWFGQSSHMNIGYSSTDPNQIKKQITDMISRGIDGVIIDWYGPNNSIDQATQLVMAEAEQHPGFTFGIMVDQGAIQWFSCAGCDPQQALTADMQYLEQTYFTSPAYMTVQGKPFVTDFAIDQNYTIDWNALNASLATHPLFVFQNNNGFSHTLSGGGYSWVIPTTNDYGMSYLTSFYDTGLSSPSEQTIGATYKGFNDTLASWGQNRIMGQQCGQTWLQTFSLINGLYNSGRQLPYLQLVTWNDYEEGTEMESGIDNCLSVSASIAGNTLQWSVNGNENTLDQYVAYISTDGQNLMPLTQTAPGNRSINLCSYSIPSGSYKLFIQAVGKPGIANQMSPVLGYSPSCAAPPAPSFTMSAAPASIQIAAGSSGKLAVSASSTSGVFNNPIALSCAAPSGITCAFAPASITPGSGTAQSTLTIWAPSTAVLKVPGRGPLAIYASLLLPFGFICVPAGWRKRKTRIACLFLVCLGVTLLGTSCGGGSTFPAQNLAPKSYSVIVNGNAGGAQQAVTVTVTIP